MFLRLCGLLLFCSLTFAQSSFLQDQLKWRQEREQALKAEDGWLTVSGLFWLKEGVNTFGTGKDQSIVLPKGSAPESVGTLELAHGVVTLKVAEGVTVRQHKEEISELKMEFADDSPPPPFMVGSLNLSVIKRGERYGLRVRDKNSKARRDFTGLDWFAANPSYRVVADFNAYPEPKEILIVSVLGDQLKLKTPGTLSFVLLGKRYEVRPVIEDEKKLFIIFRDLTAGKTTYGAGRYLYAELPKDGKVVLDFNRAENPPCAFTDFATCPLPPKENRLPLAIPAGEKSYHLR